jgi:hypothetical protein
MDGRIIRVKNLTDQLGMPHPRPFLFCAICGVRYSANASDYFYLSPEYVMAHCGEPMRLVKTHEVLQDV